MSVENDTLDAARIPTPRADLLKNISIDTQTMSDWTHQVVVDKSEPVVVVQEWIAANSERIDGWLGL